MTEADPEKPERESSGTSSKSDKPPNKRRGDQQQSSNALWYVVVLLIFAFVAFAVLGRQPQGNKLSFREFLHGIETKTWHSGCVYELTFEPGQITFQDQPQSRVAGERGKISVQYYYVYTTGIPDGDLERLTGLLDTRGIDFGYPQKPSQFESLAFLLIVPVLLLLFFMFLFRRIGGAGTAMSFGRSRGRLYAQEDIEITFDDVAGIEEALEELREIVEFLRSPEKYQSLGGRIPRGVLLVGPPGTGKTLLAKAVAGEAGVPFYSLSGSDFVEMFVGVGAARVRDMFQQAGQRSPSIIFIDELDALGKVRGSGMPGGHDEREQTLNALLVEMDGFESDQSVIVMAATNRPETLDPALLRPGRFDRHVLVDRPDIRGREAILKVHAARIKMDDKVELQRVARLTPGFVGADLANLVNEAALLAVRRNDTKVTMPCFEEGIERVMAGLEKQSRIIVDEVKQRVAFHECGHALVACTLPNTDPVHKISIIPRGLGALGYTLQIPEDERELVTQSELESRVCVLLGGIAAEQIVYNETSTGAQNDLQRATDIARRMVTEFGMSPRLGRMYYSDVQRSPFMNGNRTVRAELAHSEDTVREIDLEVKRIIDECFETAHGILVSQRETLDHLSRNLVETETMDADQLRRILDEHRTGPQIKPGTHAAAGGSDSVEDRSEGDSDPERLHRESADGT